MEQLFLVVTALQPIAELVFDDDVVWSPVCGCSKNRRRILRGKFDCQDTSDELLLRRMKI